jgi:hypothetical protein
MSRGGIVVEVLNGAVSVCEHKSPLVTGAGGWASIVVVERPVNLCRKNRASLTGKLNSWMGNFSLEEEHFEAT